jgi:FlaA1/EpsC-like NDP-sugar epimerase
MTRFMITLDAAVDLVWTAFEDMGGGEIYVKKIPSIGILDIAKAVSPDAELVYTGIRPGEKLHEQMIGVEDARTAHEFEEYYKIFPSVSNIPKNPKLDPRRQVPEGFTYTSDKNTHWMSREFLAQWIEDNKSSLEAMH